MATVIIVWGIIGYKIINGMSPDASPLKVQEFNNAFKPKALAEVDPFYIQDVEVDPFLGTLASVKKKQNPRKLAADLKPKPSKIISYGGIVKKQKSSEQVFVVNINNSQYLLKKGQVADSIKLIRGNIKEIVVRYNNISQTIKRQ
ncbi:hypothetical protein DIS18_05415 [Algibacter marinivivus]|uniref:Uncharacterized protein n=1 Tax=Algibacter marinivivus TaxID=2100723 RepID=A0A2U2X853_9FLAO|nr:hypothetical protein DIS18_05415 [Algibacter marinivivus]